MTDLRARAMEGAARLNLYATRLAGWSDAKNFADLATLLEELAAKIPEWRSMESAPKDGTAVWLLWEGQVAMGYFDPDDAFGDAKWFLKASFERQERPRVDSIFGCYQFGIEPTAWQPLPAAPSPSDTEKKA